MTLTPSRDEAYEIVVGGPDGRAPVVLTCEHATNRLPAAWSWTEADERLIDMHWAWDIGAADFTREVCGELGASGVLSRFSRLLVDANRPLDAPDLFREVCDGRVVGLNRELSWTDRHTRLEDYYQPYHDAIDLVLREVQPKLLLAIHSFTPVYEGQQREVELGVLHFDQPELAERWRDLLASTGMDVRVDEPYTGGDGFMYSPWLHSHRQGCPAIELELRQDIVGDPRRRPALVELIRYALVETGVVDAA